MRAAVTGATGFLGRHLVRRLLREGHQVQALVRRPGREARLPGGVSVHHGDLADGRSLEGFGGGADVLFHLGGAISGGWEVHREATVEGTRRILELARGAGISRIVHISSIVVFDTRGLAPRATVTGDSPLAPAEPFAGPYARGKIEAERLVREAAARGGPPAIILRPGIVYGPGRLIFPHLGARAGSLFLAVGGAGLLLPLCSRDSVTEACLRVAAAALPPDRAFTVVDENDTTRGDYLRLLGEATGRRYRILPLPVAPVAAAAAMVGGVRRLPGLERLPDTSGAKVRGRALSLRYETAPLREACGWRPPLALEAAMRRDAAFEGKERP